MKKLAAGGGSKGASLDNGGGSAAGSRPITPPELKIVEKINRYCL